MKFKPSNYHNLTLAVLMIGLSACSSKPHVREFPSSASADQEITNLQAAMDNSRKENVDLLAPTSFTEAKHALQDAQEMKKDDKSEDKVLKEVALGRAYLERAEKNAKENTSTLQSVLTARQKAMDAKANILLRDRFAAVDGKVKEESAKLEDDKYTNLKENRPKFVTDYMDLELAAIKEQHIGQVKKIIDEAKKNGAESLTPQTYNEAVTAYTSAETYIKQNKDDVAGIEERSATAAIAASKLRRTVDTARGLTKTSPEDAALRLQAEEENLNRTKSALNRERGTTMALAATNTELSREKDMQAIYEEARSKFSPEEAEVYKQGDKLVIRLRSLEFPKGQAVIRGSNFGLLRKVDDVIASFGKSAVTVEGHTDSSGGKTLNEKLSNERAGAVKDYLEANTAEGVAKFDSKGYGYERPISSNKSAEGRAQNRRVDVIIAPEQI